MPYEDARRIVDAMNECFSPNGEMNIPFYRLWSRGENGVWQRYPTPQA